MNEPTVKRAVAFFDGQNLYRHAKDAFGHHHPNYDPTKLTDRICANHDWTNSGVRFYTGTPSAEKAPMWHRYWSNRLLGMRRAGILVTHRPIRYREEIVRLRDGSTQTIETPQEKGIDIRIALDVVRMTRANQLDVVLIFSQDQDLAEVADEVREIARLQNRWIKICSAYPCGLNATATRGIDKTDWIKLDQNLYDACLDPRDYRPKPNA